MTTTNNPLRAVLTEIEQSIAANEESIMAARRAEATVRTELARQIEVDHPQWHAVQTDASFWTDDERRIYLILPDAIDAGWHDIGKILLRSADLSLIGVTERPWDIHHPRCGIHRRTVPLT